MKRVTLKKREMSYAMTEELNTLRTNIQFSGVDKKVIVMTSSFSGEVCSGKLTLVILPTPSKVGRPVVTPV